MGQVTLVLPKKQALPGIDLPKSPTELREFLFQRRSVAGCADQPFAAKVSPNLNIDSAKSRIILARLDGSAGAALHFGFIHVRVKECTAIGGLGMHSAFAVE